MQNVLVRRRKALAFAGVAIVVAAFFGAARADRLTLWRIVHEKCVAASAAGGGARPCESVDLSQGEDKGVAILKDINGVAQLLAIPTRRVSGIESADLIAADAPNYWRAAWAARKLMDARLGRPLPREAIGIAVNSGYARSQDQLHLHVDCLDPAVVAELARDRDGLTEQWHVMPAPLNGRRYWARRLESPELADVNPFRLLAQGVPGAGAAMGQETLVAVGATFAPGRPGFILLADDAGLGAGGHGEDLQDHSCAIAKTPG